MRDAAYGDENSVLFKVSSGYSPADNNGSRSKRFHYSRCHESNAGLKSEEAANEFNFNLV